jgi:diguanylate cyclase (GGDEF)-like protein
MFAANADADTERALDHARMLEATLAAIGAVDAYEAVARAIADGARQLSATLLVTLTVPAADGGGTLVVASGDMIPGMADDLDVDQLPVIAFSLRTERHDDETLPVLHLHGAAADGVPRLALLRRFAPHARLALERAQRLADVTRLAYSDPLTGLANLRGLQNALEREATFANAEGHSLALLIIDLDDFRRYNTLWGHLVGDAALQAFARAIRSATRSTDFVARVGGEEFAVLLPDSGESEARTVATHIHDAIATGSGGLPSPFTASIGIGIYPNDVPNAFSLYAVADTAMTMAKKAGKNRTFAFETMDGPAR